MITLHPSCSIEGSGSHAALRVKPGTNHPQTVSGTVTSASALLNTWTRILSQTEHNHRLIQDPNWKGATQDVLDVEAEAIQKQQAAERRAAEEQRRREETKRRAEEEERRRQAGTTTSTRGTRGVRGTRGLRTRGGAVSRGGVSAGESSASGIPSVRGSGIGRSTGSVRGRRARGVR